MEADRTPTDIILGNEGVASARINGQDTERRFLAEPPPWEAQLESGDVLVAALQYVPHFDGHGEIADFAFDFRIPNPTSALQLGARLVQRAKEWAESSSDQRKLPFLIWHFRDVALRLEPIHRYLNDILRRHGDVAVSRILGRGRGRGRPHQSPQLMHAICLIDWLREHRSLRVTEAAGLVHGIWEPAGSCGTARLRNLHSEYGALAQIVRGGYFVPSAALVPYSWCHREHQWSMFVPNT